MIAPIRGSIFGFPGSFFDKRMPGPRTGKAMRTWVLRFEGHGARLPVQECGTDEGLGGVTSGPTLAAAPKNPEPREPALGEISRAGDRPGYLPFERVHLGLD